MSNHRQPEPQRRNNQVRPDSPRLAPEAALSLAARGAEALEKATDPGQPESLDKAIELLERAQAALSHHPAWPGILSVLGLALRERFDREGGVEDLERAIHVFRQAVDAAPDGDEARPVYASNLGLTLVRRSERYHRMEDLDEAVELTRQAVESTPEGHPARPGVLSNLGFALQLRLQSAEPGESRDEDLNEVVEVARRIVEETPEGHADRPFL